MFLATVPHEMAFGTAHQVVSLVAYSTARWKIRRHDTGGLMADEYREWMEIGEERAWVLVAEGVNGQGKFEQSKPEGIRTRQQGKVIAMSEFW